MKTVEIRRTENGIFSKEKEVAFLKAMEENEVKIHGLMFSQNQKVFFEKYYGEADGGRAIGVPNSEYCLHRMYSITKSFTAIGIGLLAEEGKLKLDDRIFDYFKDDFTEAELDRIDNRVKACTIKDALTMKTCHTKTTYKRDLTKDWVKSFFLTEPDKNPGERFNYDTSGSHVLTALVERLSSMDMMDYLKDKLSCLGFSNESYIIKDPFGVEIGGSGLMCTMQDLYRFSLLIENKGYVCNRRLISEKYIKECIAIQSETAYNAKHQYESFGYGYYFWINDHDTYMCFGKDGQFIVFVPKKSMVLITTADTSANKNGNQLLLDALYEYVYR